ncbi:hypothetical protein GP657_25035 [Escherichia coli]|nr:hypothetical protein [Escherichia coli]
MVSTKNDGHYFCGAGGNRPDGLNEPVTNNKTDRNESSRKKKNSSRNNNNISNRQMTGMKRQKHTAEHPRNERGGA